MLCGGFPSNGTCYTLSSEQWIKSSSMLERRDYGAASFRINSGLWVTGGRNIIENIGTRRTTEIYNEDDNTWSQSVDLPIEVRNHCLVKINCSHVFMTGGFNSRGFVEIKQILANKQIFHIQPSARTLQRHKTVHKTTEIARKYSYLY